jgi:serine/threonine protein phosphatase PrpC
MDVLDLGPASVLTLGCDGLTEELAHSRICQSDACDWHVSDQNSDAQQGERGPPSGTGGELRP